MSFIDIAGGLSWSKIFGMEWETVDISYNFAVMVNGIPLGGCVAVEGISRTINIEEYQEGGRNEAPRQLYNGGKWGPVVLKGGSLNQPYMWNWIHSVNETLGPLDNLAGGAASAMADPLAGGGALAMQLAGAAGGSKPTFRREVTIIHFSRGHLPLRVYHLHRAFPSRWKAANLDAAKTDSPTEELELVFESLMPLIIPLPSY
ncbi:MAG: phage tail protein [Proteobacteria bacterium]|nr:phage tail protein [Pseudomonadota bacterium]